jgi:hypothetical protein
VEGGTHYIVRVARKDGDLAAVLPVPDTNCLIVRRGDYPGEIVVELNCAHVVDVSVQCKHTFLGLIAPHFDKVVIASRNKHGLGIMKIDAAYGT